MKKVGKIITYVTGFYFGSMMAIIGFSVLTWQYWVILVPVTAGFIIGSRLEERD